MQQQTATMRELYQQWIEEMAELEPELERIRLRLEQLRTLTATLAKMDELHDVVGELAPASADASARDLQTTPPAPGNGAVGRTHERVIVDGVGIRDRVEHEMSTSDGIIAVLRDADQPMGPSEVLDEMVRRGTAPANSADALKLINTHLGRMRRDPDQPVLRPARGRYTFDHERTPQDEQLGK